MSLIHPPGPLVFTCFAGNNYNPSPWSALGGFSGEDVASKSSPTFSSRIVFTGGVYSSSFGPTLSFIPSGNKGSAFPYLSDRLGASLSTWGLWIRTCFPFIWNLATDTGILAEDLCAYRFSLSCRCCTFYHCLVINISWCATARGKISSYCLSSCGILFFQGGSFWVLWRYIWTG